jgi:hypothetical protein
MTVGVGGYDVTVVGVGFEKIFDSKFENFNAF